MEKLATVIIALGAIATLLTVILKRLWFSDKSQNLDKIAELKAEKDEIQNQMSVAIHNTPPNMPEYYRLDGLLRKIDRKITRLEEWNK